MVGQLSRLTAVATLSAALVACASNSESSTSLRWKFTENESLAYRFTVTAGPATGDLSGGQMPLREGFVFIDVDGDGRATVRAQGDVRVLAQMPSLELLPGSTNLYFPLPETAMGRAPIVQSLVIKGTGSATHYSSPDIELIETLTKKSEDSKTLRLTFDRNSPSHQEVGSGIFELARGRYQRLERTATSEGAKAFGLEVPDTLAIKISLELDPARSKARTEERALLAGSVVSADELARYLQLHPAEEEIAAEIRALNRGRASAMLVFHLRANPLATWQLAMSLPEAQAAAFVAAANRVAKDHGDDRLQLSDRFVEWLKTEFPKRPILGGAIAEMPDAKLKELLLALSSGSDQDSIARRATRSLAIIELQKQGPASLRVASSEEIMHVGRMLQADGQHRAMVPVLIQILEQEGTSRTSKLSVGDHCIQLLEEITSRSFGKDLNAWKSLWTAAKDKPYCQWMIEAAAQDSQLWVNGALQRLRSCPKSGVAADYLATRVHETGDTSFLATLSLAEHRDRRAIPPLLEMLSDERLYTRAMALIALGYFGTTTLGYQPMASVPSRAMALGRWRAWAKSL